MRAAVSAAPRAILRGADDRSTRVPPISEVNVPTHLPHVFDFASWGPEKPQLVVGNQIFSVFGDDALDLRSRYTTHQTPLISRVNGQGNATIFQRVIPRDANPPATLRLFFEYVKDEVDEFERNEDGSVKLDTDGNPKKTGNTITGYKSRWVVDSCGHERLLWDETQAYKKGDVVAYTDGSHYVATQDMEPGQEPTVDSNVWEVYVSDPEPPFGQAVSEDYPREGTLSSSLDGETSTIVPIVDFKVSHIGDHGNNIGIRAWAPTTEDMVSLDIDQVRANNSYLYRLEVIERENKKTLPDVVNTLTGSPSIDFAFNPDAYDETLGTSLYLSERCPSEYRNEDSIPTEFGPFSDVYIYQDELDSVLDELYSQEATYRNALTFAWQEGASYDSGDMVWYNGSWWEASASITDATDPPGSASNWTEVTDGSAPSWNIDWPEDSSEGRYLLNIFSGVDVDNIRYRTLRVLGAADGADELSKISNHYCAGGSDGTLTIDTFNAGVNEIVSNYGDSEWHFSDTAYWPQSVLYDSGFDMDTKKALLTPIGVRKDIGVVLSTQDAQQSQNSMQAETAATIALRTAARAYPESEFYGTPVCRAIIIGHSGYLIGSPYKKLTPATVEFAEKAARFMGAGNGIWNRNMGFDVSPNNQIETLKDVNCTYKPFTVYKSDWERGLSWIRYFDRRTLFFPAIQTVYDYDSSVLNSAVNMFILIEMEKVAERVWRRLVGNAKLTRPQFISRSNNLITELSSGRFDNRVIIVPDTYFTDYDEQLGYSWSTNIQLYLNNMYTVGTYTITSYRRSSFAG